MPENRPFEQLYVWQEARLFSRQVYRFTQRGLIANDFAMRNQLRRAAISVPANVAEGWERSRPKELLHFLTIAKASCAEVRSHLHLCKDLGYLADEDYQQLTRAAQKVGGLIGSLWLATKRRTPSP